MTDYELNLSLGGKFKMSLSYQDNLLEYPNVMDIMNFDDIIQSVELEFDPSDPQVFFFSTSAGLF